MFKSFVRELLSKKTTSWASHFDIIENVLELSGYPALKKANMAKCFKFTSALRFLVVCLLPAFSLLSILTEKDPQLRFDSVTSLAVAIHGLTKFLFLWLLKTKRERLSKYVIEVTSSLSTGSESFNNLGRKYQIFSTNITASTLLLYTVGGIAYIALPLFPISDKWKLPLHAPISGISYQNHPGYEINYFLIVLQFLFLSPCSIIFDVLFYLYCSFTVLTFELCKISCFYIGDVSSEYNTEEKQRQLVQHVANMHSDAVNFLKEFKEIFESVVLINVSTFMGTTCMFIVQIASNNQLSAYFGLFVGALQLLLYSSFGQMIISKREEFAEAIYSIKWYELRNISTRKMVLLMLMNAQKCEGIRLKGIADLSLEVYYQILKACYSFAAFLMNIM